ncbi:MAG TPA: hypothetical protein VFS21_02385 [Roseiflexaceae bacterium]|nr:hypothetical protein [Roseiflexaceae bacterium]
MTPPLTILETLTRGQRFVLPTGPLTSRLPFGDTEIHITLGVDNGNDACKTTIMLDGGRLLSLRFPAAYQIASVIRGGTAFVNYQTNQGIPYWIGEAALQNDGEALPIGPTAQRLSDLRQREFIMACIVETLNRADITPGKIHVWAGFAIPNEEIVLSRTGQREELGVSDETKLALKKWLRGTTHQIVRTDERGRSSEWTIVLHKLLPQAQSVGSYLAWSAAPNGAVLTDVEALSLLDIGGGDLQRTDILTAPYRMSTTHLGAGTIGIARALKARFPRLGLNDVAAQQALVSRQLRISGRVQDISSEVQDVIQTHGADVLGRILPALQQQSRYVLIGGGGVILLRALVMERLHTIGKVAGRDFDAIPPEYASTLNSVGALFAVMFAAGARG